MEVEQGFNIDLSEFFAMLKQRVFIIIACALVAAGIGYGYTAVTTTPQYQASALMIVNTETDSSSSVISDQLNLAARLVDTSGIVIKSDTVLQQVIRNLDLDYSYGALNGMVTVSAVNNTQVMRVTVTNPDPETARSICEQITVVAPDVIVDAVEVGSVKAASVKILSPAVASSSPISNNIKERSVTMGMLGLALCIGVIFLQCVFNNKIKSEADIAKHLGLTVLGVIPGYEGGK